MSRSNFAAGADAAHNPPFATSARIARLSLPISDRSPKNPPSVTTSTRFPSASVIKISPRSATYMQSPASPTSYTNSPGLSVNSSRCDTSSLISASDTVESSGTRRSESQRQISPYEPRRALNRARSRWKSSHRSETTLTEAPRTSSLMSAFSPKLVPAPSRVSSA